ncbi:hypothetical protein ATY81_22255 [Rhizobium sp. R72]|uniref:hypothetical protein n=1 Tax=unclassified Rhizobium TaxID=2613769 RepID=UPI000B52BAFF|nr:MULTISPECIES: hypothetical protein [unclassified Rhizobium]OWW02368.1 hypothetical protein ATY81_22255 [Rhizobium sp. R72]OWW02502.1 hypothetical protein ATY80_22255 [Rhizobium sp. R711]
MSKPLNEDLNIENRQSFIPPEMELEPVSLSRLQKEKANDKGGVDDRSNAPKAQRSGDDA